ncbi:MAG: alpha/beta fold hydrolase [Labilithrix sp.]|nr:alpha/beta fold hydrolase [Labilithrix sp.]MCW5816555.1 alpha/beta fold hydrolase [Labilithrix sp.]
MKVAFRPPRWLRSPHLQTIAGTVPVYAPPKTHARAEEEDLRIPLGDEGCLHARAWWATPASERAPAVVILHGIAGSKDSLCCVRAAVALHRAGYHAVRLDMRAAGESVVDAPSLYHGGLTTDLDLTVRHLLAHPRVESVLVLGFSGGGSIALKLAGEWGKDAPPGVRAIASISAPLDYVHVAARMDTFACALYRYHVLGGLLDRARAFAERHPSRVHYKVADLHGIKRFRAYDDAVIVPMHRFESVDHYYRAVSSGPYLEKIEVPSIVIHAEDDPMVPIRGVRPWFRGAAPSVRTVVSEHGGHIGWVGGFDEASWIKGWAMSHALSFFAEHR